MAVKSKNSVWKEFGLILTVAGLLIPAGGLFAQMPMPREGMPGIPVEGMGGSPQATQAAQGVGAIKDRLLMDYVSQALPLMPEDIESIRGELKKITPFQGQMDKTNRGYISMIEAYLAFYSGQAEESLEKARKGYQMDEENSDISDTLITLGLCNENYSLVKPILKKRNGGEDVVLPPLTDKAGVAAGGPGIPGQMPGMPGMGMGMGQRPESGKPSKWSVDTAGPGMGGARGVEFGERGMMMGGPPAGGGRGGFGATGGQPGILNLAVKCMPGDNLGEDFGSLNLRALDSTYFYFETGKGQILCVFLWTLPFKAEGPEGGMPGEFGRGGPARPGFGEPRGMMSTPYRGGAPGMPGMEGKSTIPQIAFDLTTNLEQYRQLMLQNSMHGRMFFMTANLDAANQTTWYRVLTTFTEEPWPWANCMVNDPTNSPQWTIKQRYSPIMAIVDTHGKIRYMGPVGGFLPRMLLTLELMKSKPLEAMAPPAPPQPVGATPQPSPEAAAAAQAPAPAAETKPAEPAKVSDPQAKSMLQTIYLKKKISPVSSLQMCDELMTRYPDSLEADEAKLIIKSILSTRSNLVDQRKKEGKYTGE
jgi:hypothetical protein